MTTILVDTTVDQSWINGNTAPWTLSNGVTVTFGSDLSITSGSQYFVMTTNSRLNGVGYKVTASVGTMFGLSRIVSNSQTGIIIENIGVVTNPSITTLVSGLLRTDSYVSLEYIIRRCYSVGTVGGSNWSGGIVGGNTALLTSSGKAYIHDCYHIGDVTTTNGNGGGIVGRGVEINSVLVVSNCYNIGTVSSTNGAILGGNMSANGARVYMINCYYSNGSSYSSIGSTPGYLGYNREYAYSGSWSDSTAINTSLYTQESGGTQLDATEIITTGNYTNITGSPTSSDLTAFASYLSSYEGVSPYYSYFKFPPTDTPFGLQYFVINPFRSFNYTDATDEAKNCLCKGTKITIIDEDGIKDYISIENVMQGMTVMTPHGEVKKVLNVVRQWCNGTDEKYEPYLIRKDEIYEGVPSEDIYCSGNHSFIYPKRDGYRLGLKRGRARPMGNGYTLFMAKDFATKQDFQYVSLIKGETGYAYGFYYYHLVIEDNYGFYANGMQSESLDPKELLNTDRYEEINIMNNIHNKNDKNLNVDISV